MPIFKTGYRRFLGLTMIPSMEDTFTTPMSEKKIALTQMKLTNLVLDNTRMKKGTMLCIMSIGSLSLNNVKKQRILNPQTNKHLQLSAPAKKKGKSSLIA